MSRTGCVYRFGDVELDTQVGSIRLAGRPLAFEPRTFDLLVHLVEHRGALLLHEDVLNHVWGDVSVTPHSLTQAISQIRRALHDDSRSPRFIQTVHRKGYRFVATVDVQVADRAARALPASMAAWCLPAPSTSLIGREALIQSLVSRLSSSRMLTLVGPGGVGKTQLALEVGRRIENGFKDGAVFADVAAEQEAPGVARALSRALHVATGEGPAAADAIVTGIGACHVLVLLDNCEHLSEACATLADTLVTRCPNVTVLATSQRPLETAGETLVRVPLLSVPEGSWTPAAADDRALWPAAVRLFVERASALNAEFRLSASNATAVAEICRRLDGLPLAIELAAARTTVLTAAQIEDRLGERFELLASRGRVYPPRQQTLAATVAWSAGLLTSRAQQLLDRLAVFGGGWTLEALQAIAADDGRLVDDLAALVDGSLVVADVARPEARYRLLETIRLYALARLRRSAEYVSLRDKHLQYFCTFAERIDDRIGTDPVGCLRRVREEYANVSEAFGWAIDTSARAETGLRLAAAMRWVWRLEGEYVASCERLMQALAAAPEGPPPLRARVRLALGMMQHHRAEFREASESIERGLAELPAEERWERTHGTILLAFNETLGGSRDRGDCLAAQIGGDVRALKDSRLEAFALIRDGVGRGLGGHHRLAARLLSDACDRLRRGRDPFLLSYGTVNLGLQRYLAGQRAASRDVFQESLHIACELDNLRAVAATIEGFAYLSCEARDYRWAVRLLGTAARLREMTAAPLFAHWRPTHDRITGVIRERLGTNLADREMHAGGETPARAIIDRLLAE